MIQKGNYDSREKEETISGQIVRCPLWEYFWIKSQAKIFRKYYL